MTFGHGRRRVSRLGLRRHTFSNDAAAAHDLFQLSLSIHFHSGHLDRLSNDVADVLQPFILAERNGWREGRLAHARVDDGHVSNFAFCRGLSSDGRVR